MKRNDSSTAAKWNFIDFQSPSFSAVMMEYTTPPSYGSTVVNVGGLATDGQILCAGSGANSVEHTKVTKDTENDWTSPEALKIVWRGSNKDGKAVSATLAGDLGTRLDKVDVMEKVPGFIKTLVGGVVGTKPYIYQVRSCQLNGQWLKKLTSDESIRHRRSSQLLLILTELKPEKKESSSWKRPSFLKT